MQQKEIKYTGITARPSDYDSPDGDLATAINVTNEDGNIKPVFPSNKQFTLLQEQNLLYIHKTPNFCNYIVHDSALNRLCYFTNTPNNAIEITSIDRSKILQVNAIGNTLLLLSSEGVYYFLHKKGSYVSLGQKPPFLNISFGLAGSVCQSSEYEINMDKNKNPATLNQVLFSEETKTQVTDQVSAHINTFIKQYSIDLGGFIFPFFVRFAYRAYGGSYMQSTPVLMIPNSGRMPYMPVSHTEYDNGILKKIKIRLNANAGRLSYSIFNFTQTIKELEKWEDLIEYIDIYISQPIYTYDQEGKCSSVIGGGIPMFPSPGTGHGKLSIGEQDSKGDYIYRVVQFNDFSEMQLIGPYIEKKDIYKKIKETSNFHKVFSIKIKDLKEKGDYIKIEPEKLSTLQAQERLTEEHNPHDTIIPSYSFEYNSRLNIANIKRKLFGFPSDALMCYTNGILNSNNTPEIRTFKYLVFIFVLENGKDLLVQSNNNIPLCDPPDFVFYPNPNATRIVIEQIDNNGTKLYFEAKMEKHEFLNGSYYFGEFGGIKFKKDFDASVLTASEPITYHPNKIYTSEVNNPFQFPATGINSVGSGGILAISSSTKALSQGQFGQFPLYAFTTEGVWALEVSSTGSYSARQPATRDICNNPKSIMQLDGAIAFTTDQGIMLLSGSESKCISDILNGPVFDKSKLASFDKLLENVQLTTMPFSYIPFKEYLKECQMSFDYPNSRIFIFNPVQPYSYVYNLKSNTWSIISESFKDTLNTYPDSYLSKENGDVVNLSSANSSRPVNAIIVTRPLKIDTPDLLKTITQAIHRGIFTKGDVKSVLYGSRDGINFILVTSSTDHTLRSTHGSPFKYFRFVIIAELSYGESISGTSIVFDTKQTNKLR